MIINRYVAYLRSLPHNWELKPIEQIGKVFTGGTPRRVELSFWNGTIAWVTPGEITSLKGKYITKTHNYITELGLASCAATLLPHDALLITTRATIGAVAIAGIEVSTNQGFKSIVLGEDDSPLFYYYLFSGIVCDEMRRIASGSTFDEISRKDFVRINVPRPRSFEQLSIADILDTVDEQIHHTEQLIAKLKNQRAGLLYRLLTCGIDGHGHLRASSNYNGTSLQIDIKKFPKEWGVRPLGTVAEIGSGLTLNKKLSTTDAVTLPYLRVANVQDGYLDLAEVKTVSVTKDDIPKYLLQPNDVLMIEDGDFDKLGRGTIWRGQISPCLHQNHIFRVRPDTRYLLPEFLTLLSGSSYGKRFFMLSSKQSTNLASINSTQLKSFPIPCPSIAEQREILRVISEYDDDMHIEETHLEKLKLYKTGLMRDLLTGNVRVVNVPNEAEH